VTENAIAPTTDDAKREVALLKAIGFDRLAPEQRELALHLANRYELDPMLRHIAVIDGRPVLTRDALLHIAHRSGVFDGIQVTRPVLEDAFWRCTCTVWRKDWTHNIQYDGRFPDAGRKGRATEYAEEMAVKCAESMALRRAFDVAAPILEERWDAEPAYEPPTPKPTLAERAATRAAEITVLAEPMSEEASAKYVNAEEVAEGARPVLRLPASDEAPPWTRERLHEAAVNAHVSGTLVTSTFNAVAGSRSRAELTEADWAEIALRLGLGA
jgi:hypothetical protein